MPKPPEPRHHTATHYGAVPGFISSGHASDAGSHRASDAGSGNEGKMPFGRGGATVHGDAVLANRKKPYKSLGWSLSAVRAAPPRSTPLRFFFGRGPRPEAAARRRPPQTRVSARRTLPRANLTIHASFIAGCRLRHPHRVHGGRGGDPVRHRRTRSRRVHRHREPHARAHGLLVRLPSEQGQPRCAQR